MAGGCGGQEESEVKQLLNLIKVYDMPFLDAALLIYQCITKWIVNTFLDNFYENSRYSTGVL